MTAAFEVMHLPVISTSHLPYSGAAEELGNSTHVAIYEYGYFIYLDESALDDEPSAWPEWYLDLCRWGIAKRFWWVRLDRDAPKVPDLETWDW
jgi:hypothetical protein